MNCLSTKGKILLNSALRPLMLLPLLALVGTQVFGANTFRTVALESEIADLHMNPTNPTPVRVASGTISGPYEHSGNTIRFFGRNEDTGAVALQAVSTIPSGIRQPLLVFLNIPQRLADGTEVPYSTAVVDDSRKGFPIHSVRFFNTASFPLAVSFSGQSPFVLTPGQSQVVRHGALASNKIETVQLAAPNADGQWQRIGAGEIYLRRNGRHLVFLDPKSTDPVEELGPQELKLVIDMRRIPAPLPEDGE